jgi:hypothetical protein
MTTEARFVDLTCRGLRVAQKARLSLESPTVGFLEIEAPLPIGTRVQVAGEGDFQVEARVTKVIEQEAGARSPPGMRIDWSPPVAVTQVMPPPPVGGAAELEAAEEEVEAPAEPPAAESGPAPTDGRRKRGSRKKTIIGR